MKIKKTQYLGLIAISFGVLSFALHAIYLPHNNVLLIIGLVFVLMGVIGHVAFIKYRDRY